MKLYPLYILLTVLILSSCSSSRRLAIKPSVEASPTEARTLFEQTIDRQSGIESLYAKANFEVQLPGKGNRSVGGSLRIVRDRGIQLSIAPLFGMEMFRAEITPDGITVINRISRQYTTCDYRDLSTRLHTTVTYNAIQALFLNELFLTEEPLKPSDWRLFQTTPMGSTIHFSINDHGQKLAFSISSAEHMLEHTDIRPESSNYAVTCRYDNFASIERTSYPSLITFNLEGKRTATLKMDLSRFRINEGDWLTGGINSRYSRITLDELLNQIP